MELYQLIVEHVTGGHFKGKKSNVGSLPSTGNHFKDIWNVSSNDYIQGDDYIWNGKEWLKLTSALDLSMYATLASPTFTGTPKAPTVSAGDSSTKIATTAFVQGAITSAVGALVTDYGLTPVSSGGAS